MAFAQSGLILLTPHGRDKTKVWYYESTDTAATVDTSGYFNSASHLLSVGDLIFAKCNSVYGFIIVNANASGVVDVNDMVPLGGVPTAIYLQGQLADVSTASSVYFVAPVAGTITTLTTVLGGAISGANSAVTASIGATPITGGAVTVAHSGSAAGDIDSATTSAANVVAAGDLITVATDGASTGTATLGVRLTLVPSTPSLDTD